MTPKRKEIEQGRCQAVAGEHQCDLPAGHTGEHREGKIAWATGSRLQIKLEHKRIVSQQ